MAIACARARSLAGRYSDRPSDSYLHRHGNVTSYLDVEPRRQSPVGFPGRLWAQGRGKLDRRMGSARTGGSSRPGWRGGVGTIWACERGTSSRLGPRAASHRCHAGAAVRPQSGSSRGLTRQQRLEHVPHPGARWPERPLAGRWRGGARQHGAPGGVVLARTSVVPWGPVPQSGPGYWPRPLSASTPAAPSKSSIPAGHGVGQEASCRDMTRTLPIPCGDGPFRSQAIHVPPGRFRLYRGGMAVLQKVFERSR
jgi:hypothetical protein